MRKMQIVVTVAMAILAVAGVILVARGGDWFLVALPVCVCTIGLAGLTAGGSIQGRRATSLPVLLVGVLGVALGVVSTATSETPINIFMLLAVFGTIATVVGALIQVRRAAAQH